MKKIKYLFYYGRLERFSEIFSKFISLLFCELYIINFAVKLFFEIYKPKPKNIQLLCEIREKREEKQQIYEYILRHKTNYIKQKYIIGKNNKTQQQE